MLAMQYRFTLPADYDMAIIKKRIELAGPKLDNFPGLLFKTFLYCCKKEGSPENRYAPFYLWRDTLSMQRFLQSPGFAALTRDFGWPRVDVWTVLHAPDAATLDQASYAVIGQKKILPFSDLNTVASEAMLCGWDTSRWRLLTADFTKDRPSVDPDKTAYRIGYIARGRGYE
ncbi:DUF4865 family protein [Kalamiella sp. sgz302252]|uniref:DUF4865 family protein n=1 Tax=Pantoea sp. sgz302252 TaxID=3341827 RepID=UPI0036D371F3